MITDEEDVDTHHYRRNKLFPERNLSQFTQGGLISGQAVYNKILKRNDYSPSGIITPAQAALMAPWDGIPLTPGPKTDNQIMNHLFANENVPFSWKGMQQLYDEVKPFNNVNLATIEEVEHWYLMQARQIRIMFGYDPNTLNWDRCLSLQCQWWAERNLTDVWEKAPYTGYDTDDPTLEYGPCVISGGSVYNTWCGSDFVPRPEDQLQYFPSTVTDFCPGEPATDYNAPGFSTQITWSWIAQLWWQLRSRAAVGRFASHWALLEPILTATKMGWAPVIILNTNGTIKESRFFYKFA